VSREPDLLGLVVEGPSDARTVPGLTDRVLRERMHIADLDAARAFGGLDASAPFLKWSNVNDEARRRGVPRKHGHFGGEPAIEGARAAHQALQCFVGADRQPSAVLLVRDSDGKLEDRLAGLRQAREERRWPFPVVVGVAHAMRECWVLAGFVARGKREPKMLEALRKELRFDPVQRSERLDAALETAPKSAKRVLALLTGDDREREEQCWIETDLAALREQGARNGLADFLDEVEERLAPIFAGKPR
jgi:hypothetical protein